MSNLNICEQAIAYAKKLGATDVACSVTGEESQDMSVEHGQIKDFGGSTQRELSLKVYVGDVSCSGSTTNLNSESVKEFVKIITNLAKEGEPDPYDALAASNEITLFNANALKALDLYDPTTLTPEQMLQMACEMESSAYAVQGVSLVANAVVGCDTHSQAVAMSNGYAAEGRATSFGAYAVALAEQGGNKFQDYSHCSARHLVDFDKTIAEIGAEAGQKVVAKTNCVRLPKAGKMPVLLSPQVAGSLIKGAILNAASGAAMENKQGYFKPSDIGTQVLGSNITLRDDRTLARAMGTPIFASGGIEGKAQETFIQNGELRHVTASLKTARKLGLDISLGRPKAYNPYLEVGQQTPAELAAGVKYGVYITSVMNGNKNPITGDISLPANGFIIRDGVITNEFVSDIGIAGNILDVLRGNVTFANDQIVGVNAQCATALVEGLTVSSS